MGLVHEWHSNNREIALRITITSPTKKRFFIVAQNGDRNKINSKYARRDAVVEGSRTITLSFPVTPEVMSLGIYNKADKNDADFQVEYEEVPLKTWQVWLDMETRSFLRLAIKFCQVAGYEPASANGREFSDGYFKIKFYPVIVDQMKGHAISTPARIGHNSGIIDIAKNKFDNYTFAERMVIILHEFSHKYRNPKLGFPISNETGADINALYIYLGMGFSKIDAINVFANVFLRAQTPGNIKRMRAIMDYIQKFEQGDFAQVA